MARIVHSGITTATNGSTIKVGSNAGNYSVQVDYATAAPTAATTTLQGSLDGSTWLDLGNTTDVSAVTVGFSVVDKPFDNIRVNLTSITAGTCTGVTIRLTIREEG